MKKILSLTLVCLLVVALFAGCGGSSDPSGKYVLESINGKSPKEYLEAELEGTGMSLDAAASLLGIDMDKLDEFITFELKDNGKAVVASTLMDMNEEGEWKLDGEKLTITVDGDPEEFQFKGGKIIGSMGDDAEIVLVKK